MASILDVPTSELTKKPFAPRYWSLLVIVGMQDRLPATKAKPVWKMIAPSVVRFSEIFLLVLFY